MVFLAKTNYLKRNIILLLFASFYYCSLYCQSSKYFQQKVNYNLSVSLDDKLKTLDGFEQIEYFNNSPDTLKYIWIHLWPNAYKNDQTAFSEQLLKNGRTDFYFSNESERGYINRLEFKVDGKNVKVEDSIAIDITKIILNEPLVPLKSIIITTPFHEKLPYNFSRGGYTKNGFQITQWYPKPAVYDKLGWHPMSYLDQGEFYSEFGNFDVKITVPKDYKLAATGVLQNDNKLNKGIIKAESNKESSIFKTLEYRQDNIHDFAWFANKKFQVVHDTLKLASGRIIDCQAFYNPSHKEVWQNSLLYIKNTIRSRSEWLGEYPYDVVTVVEATIGFTGGMEYPTITSISPMPSKRLLETLIEHEVGHNWNYGILASNERDHPWMDEGINTYFDRRYLREISPAPNDPLLKSDLINRKLPDDLDDLFYRNLLEQKKDQPIETTSEKFTELNYNLTVYHKTALWMEKLETFYGRQTFDSILHNFYFNWKFKHPSPEDFKQCLDEYSKIKPDTLYDLIYQRGGINRSEKKQLKISGFMNFRNTDLYNYILLSPAVGYNHYDGFMVGLLLHNFTLPANKFQFLVAPLYATQSKNFTGISRFQYHHNSYGTIQQMLVSITASRFSNSEFTDSTGKKTFLNYSKIVPSVRVYFKSQDARSTVTTFVQFKTYFLKEKNVLFSRDTILKQDIITYPYKSSYINQLKFVLDEHRVLYPYRGELQFEQSTNFAKLTFTGKYYFNYATGGGLNVRLFGGKFFYIGDKTSNKQFETDRYHLNLTGANGYEDYTYSNYFIGRNEFDKLPSQQIMIRDGGFKVRSDLLSAKIGKTDDWLAAVNFQSDIPDKINPLQILPINIPLMLFLDIGTYADGFKQNAVGSKFLYDAGIQISLIKNLINIYIPLAYSKVYRDYYKQTITGHRFLKTLSFSIDLQNLNLRKFNPEILL